MKKVSAILISIVMAVLLAACGGGSSMPAGRQIQPVVRPEKMRILKEG